ncbi:hypothetical protein SAMN05216525_1589 [Bradyrhizobium sp. Gha]|nr:hypothetical protein SAMN05216525_1589 [Bradyrhizobium sp. Gha]
MIIGMPYEDSECRLLSALFEEVYRVISAGGRYARLWIRSE